MRNIGRVTLTCVTTLILGTAAVGQDASDPPRDKRESAASETAGSDKRAELEVPPEPRVEPARDPGPGVTAFDERFDIWPVDLKINGRIFVDNGVRDFAALERLFASVVKGKKVACFFPETLEDNRLADEIESHLGDKGSIEQTPFSQLPVDTLRAALSDADVVVLLLQEHAPESTRVLRKLQTEFAQFIRSGRTLFCNAAAGQACGTHDVRAAAGLALVPDCVLACDRAEGNALRNELLSVLALHPRSVGVRLGKGAMLLLSGRKMMCYGEGAATFMLMANERQPLRIESISPPTRSRRAPSPYIDLTEWRRDAIDRTLEPFPPAEPKTPFVENGTLVIVGGGGMPQGLMRQIVDMAGGVDNARMVYIPCTEQDQVSERQRTVDSWKAMGVKHATFIHTKDRNKANTDEEFLTPLKTATGLWFGGGRQWNFADSYYGTEAHRLMKQVLARGGVIAGSSAGASIQGRYLARATPIGNSRIMAPGYERGGLGFLCGVAIDQHFSQRGRQKDMTQLVNRYPQLLGIGLDEATAIIVRKANAEVVGRGKAHFYDRNQPVYPDRPDFVALPAGSIYDLAERQIVRDVSDKTKESAAPVGESP